MSTALYSIGTWDANAEAYTPQDGLSVASLNVPLPVLRAALRELRNRFGYGAWRMRGDDGDHDSDWAVLVERTDGMPEAEIMEQWKR